MDDYLTMRGQCPKWEKCNAPICPLDPDWNKRRMLEDEPTCFYLTEAVKPGAQAIFDQRGLGELFKLVSESVQPISDMQGRIRRQLERAKTTGSRMTKEAPWLNARGGP